MATTRQAPFQAQNHHEVADMLRGMEAHSKSKGRGGFSIRKKTFETKIQGHTVDSWQMQDWDYKKPHLPTYARGIFTHRVAGGQPEIAVRGYDKFFNVDEVNSTQWRNIENNTRGPYELSVKENGCIIFIAGLDDQTIIVTSKHSTGPRGDAGANHSLVGEKWLNKQLASLGKSQADLARRLREMNATAVAELCDDDFEEHVLAYTPEQAGLYLHGINLNLPTFATYPAYLVDKFATEWGFKQTMYVMEDKIHKVKSFLDAVAETGNYNGRDTEGFVIRCQARDTANGPWYDWFFKYKFEEPYLMYRQWRECTKAVISGKPPKFKKHKKITEEYLLYARRQLAKDPKIGKLYNQNHGIIAMRDGFLAEKGMKGSDIIQQEMLDGEHVESKDMTRNVLLVPIATLGCGKTTVALALTKLFGWGHEQNDNIEGKQRRPQRFAMAITNSMALHPAVIADRNNHQKRERQQILEDVEQVIPESKFVALNYVHDRSNYDSIRQITQERVLSRGDNHQTIQAGSKSRAEIIGIMDGFLKRFEPCDPTQSPDDAFDLIIDLDVTGSSRENLETVISAMHDHYPSLFAMPTPEDMDNAISTALSDYKPELKHDLGPSSNKNSKLDKPNSRNQTSLTVKNSKPQVPEYFCITLPTAEITSTLDTAFSSHNSERNHFYMQLKSGRRIQPSFHVTLIHRASISQHADYWNELHDTWERRQIEAGRAADQPAAPNPSDANVLGTARVQLERVVWDDRVMCIVARLVDGEGKWRTVNDVAHVTIGTAGDGIKPKESNDMLKKWLAGEGGEEVKDVRIKNANVLEGKVVAVMRR